MDKVVRYSSYIPYILALLKEGASTHTFKHISIQKLAKELNTTPQNICKILQKLEKVGLIQRDEKTSSNIRLTEECFELIKQICEILSTFLGNLTSIKLVGQVTSGLGEGSYYMSIEEYKRQFCEKLGFEPYPGTLNVRLLPEYIRYRLLLERVPGILIEGFVKNGRRFGSVKCFKARVEGQENIPCAVLIIEKTHHGPEIIEVIAPVKLRDVLKLKDGDIISLLVTI